MALTLKMYFASPLPKLQTPTVPPCLVASFFVGYFGCTRPETPFTQVFIETLFVRLQILWTSMAIFMLCSGFPSVGRNRPTALFLSPIQYWRGRFKSMKVSIIDMTQMKVLTGSTQLRKLNPLERRCISAGVVWAAEVFVQRDASFTSWTIFSLAQTPKSSQTQQWQGFNYGSFALSAADLPPVCHVRPQKTHERAALC